MLHFSTVCSTLDCKMESRGNIPTALSKHYLTETNVCILSPLTLPSTNLGNYELANIWKIYFNTAWFMGFSPFKIIHDKDEQLFKRKLSRVQWILCALVSLLIIPFSFNYPIQIFEKAFRTNEKAAFFFLAVMEICLFFLSILTFWEFWLKQRDIMFIINFLLDSNNGIPRVSPKIILKIKILMIVAFLVLCIEQFIVEEYLYYVKQGPDNYWHSLCVLGNPSLSFSTQPCVEANKAGILTLSGKVLASFAWVAKCLWWVLVDRFLKNVAYMFIFR